MRIGFFTDTYFPQVSGVATSIRTLKEELEKAGHEVIIFTATEKDIKVDQDPTIVRLPSVPFVAFTDRRMVYSGLSTAYKMAKKHHLDIIHTHTEFVMGSFGYLIARELGIPVVHTYHTHYEDYVHYIAKGRLIRPRMVKYFVKEYLRHYDAVICPSRIVQDILDGYKVCTTKQIIPTGIELDQYRRPDISPIDCSRLRQELGLDSDEIMLLSLSRISFEKNIQSIIKAMPEVIAENAKVKLIVVGDGPYLDDLKTLAEELEIDKHIHFTGMIAPDETALYYKSADFFISASTSETQGLTFTESLASGTPIIAQSNLYLADLIDHPMFGYLYQEDQKVSEAILEALNLTPTKDYKTWENKLYSISAEHFGKSVYAYYWDTIISYDYQPMKGFLGREGKKRYTHITLMRRTSHVPAQAVRTSVRVLKTPKRLVDSVREMLDNYRY